MNWLDPVRAALDETDRRIAFFVRNDDGGWDDDALDRLFGCAGDRGIAIEVAVIPAATSERSAGRMHAWIDAGIARVHQHGWQHLNHETEGRKCEFGSGRPEAAIMSDLAAGKERLAQLFGQSVDPIFTPPWNRCGRSTAQCLHTLGFEVLSRESNAERLSVPGLAEVPVNIDWFAKRKGVALTALQRGERIAECIAGGGPIGLMLHHAVTDPHELIEIGRLFDVLGSSSAAVATSMLDVASTSAQ